jgi:hypothetical protein
MMRNIAAKRRGVALVLVAAILMVGIGARSLLATPTVGWEVRGFNVPVWSVEGFRDSGPALQQLRAAGGNTATLVVTWYTPTTTSSEIRRTYATASDASLVWAMEKAAQEELRVILKPMVDVEDGAWRANIAPADGAAWWAQYRAMVLHYADLAARHDAWGMIVGNELVGMSTAPRHEAQWRALIADVRSRFDGKLTYGANWGGTDAVQEWAEVPFWDALDYIGIAAYFELSENDATATPDALTARWRAWQDGTIAPFQRRVGKPVLFTEIGYRSVQGAAQEPWNAAREGAPDAAIQTACYEATFRAWAGVPWFAGTVFWNWSANSAIDPQDTGYEVQNKPALRTVISWYGGDHDAATSATAVKVYGPLSDTEVRGAIEVEAFATNAHSVTYALNDGAPVAMTRADTDGSWRAGLDTTTLPDGVYAIVVTAHGERGTATDHAWNVRVGNDT